MMRVVRLDELPVLRAQLRLDSLLALAVGLALTHRHLLLVPMLAILFGDASLHDAAAAARAYRAGRAVLVEVLVLRRCSERRRWRRRLLLLQWRVHVRVIGASALLVSWRVPRVLFGVRKRLSVPQITLRDHEIAFHRGAHADSSLLLAHVQIY